MTTPTTPSSSTRTIHDVVNAAVDELVDDSAALLSAAGRYDAATVDALRARIVGRIGLAAVLNRSRRGRPDTRSLAVVVLLAPASGEGEPVELDRVPVRQLVHAQTGEPVDAQGLARALSPRVPADLAALDDEPADLGPDALAAFLGERPGQGGDRA